MRRLTALIAAIMLVLLAAPAVFAKEDVRATLVGPVDLDTRPGERITITWKLEDREGRPFGAGGVFVRLRSATGGRPVTAVTGGSGRFSVAVVVPEGGISRLEFGLQGWRIAGGRTSRADVLFPLENDPFARSRGRQVESAPPASPAPADDDSFPPWLALVLAVGVAAVIVGVGVGRRTHRTSAT
jgi:hypothetical protein